MEAREEKKSRAAHCLLDFLRNGTWLVCTSRASQRLNKACELLNFSSKQKTEGGTKKEGPEETKIPQRKLCQQRNTSVEQLAPQLSLKPRPLVRLYHRFLNQETPSQINTHRKNPPAARSTAFLC
jgi:hypothetical protein